MEKLVGDKAVDALSGSEYYGEDLLEMVLTLYSGECVDATTFPDLDERELVVVEVGEGMAVSEIELPPDRPE